MEDGEEDTSSRNKQDSQSEKTRQAQRFMPDTYTIYYALHNLQASRRFAYFYLLVVTRKARVLHALDVEVLRGDLGQLHKQRVVAKAALGSDDAQGEHTEGVAWFVLRVLVVVLEEVAAGVDQAVATGVDGRPAVLLLTEGPIGNQPQARVGVGVGIVRTDLTEDETQSVHQSRQTCDS